MTDIRERDFRRVDLNLLVTLHVLLRERSVSRAAACLHVGQPAVSGALARLRAVFGDPLLVRVPGGMRPTPRALALQAALVPVLQGVQALVADEPVFDPAATQRTFRIGLPDWVDTWLLPPLLATLHRDAPDARVQVVTTDRFRLPEMLAREEIDFAVGGFHGGPGWQHQRPLATARFCCMHQPGLLEDGAVLTLDRYVALPHLLVTYRNALEGTVDEALRALGRSRHVAYTSPRFSSLPRVLQQVPAIATVPDVLAPAWQHDFGLVRAPAPLDLPPIDVVIAFHAARGQDPALQWLFGVIASIVDAPAD
jgi:DNA-binding transcriptional LysR family regulator